MKRAWLPALLLVLVTQTLAAGLDWSPYPEDKDKDAQKAKAAEVRAKAAEQRAAELERQLKAAKTVSPVSMPSPGAGAPLATPSIATSAAPAVLEPLSVFRDKLKGGGEGPAMVVIPAGNFDMGSDYGDADERPVHRVRIVQSFAIGRTEVTQKEWRQVMDGVPAYFKGCDDCPVELVSWYDAQAYVRKLSEQTGKPYRLPSEAEWEYACRSGKTIEEERYCGGKDVFEVAWTARIREANRKTQLVAQKRANAFGLYDMSGNVCEWVEDGYHDSYQGAPEDGSVWLSRSEQKYRVMRGGSFETGLHDQRSTDRFYFSPGYKFEYVGFRVARTLP